MVDGSSEWSECGATSLAQANTVFSSMSRDIGILRAWHIVVVVFVVLNALACLLL